MATPKLDQKDPPILRGRVDSLTIYEVKEDELRTIEHGSTRSDQFNYAVAMLSAALTLLVTLLTAKFPGDAATAIAVALCTTFGVLGIFFLTSWFRSKDEVKITLKTIRDRAVGEPGSENRIPQRIPAESSASRSRLAVGTGDSDESEDSIEESEDSSTSPVPAPPRPKKVMP